VAGVAEVKEICGLRREDLLLQDPRKVPPECAASEFVAQGRMARSVLPQVWGFRL
jgi:hypothetical protein